MKKRTAVLTTLILLALAGAGAAFQDVKSPDKTPQAKPAKQEKKAQAAKPAPGAKQKPPDKTSGEAEIKAILDAQKAAWNAKKLDGFMDYYWKSKDLTFQSGKKVLRGWGALKARYKKNYSGDKMGMLDFSDIEVHLLGRSFAYVLGKWAVAQAGETKGGVFTLILRRGSKGWRIIHDHTE